MLTLYTAGATSKCLNYLDDRTLLEFSLPKITNVTSLVSGLCSHSQLSIPCGEGVRKCFHTRLGHGQLKIYSEANDTVTTRWLCKSQDQLSSDDEYRSSTNIAISLFKRYRNVIDRGGTDNLNEFIRAGVNAYALGCTEEGLRKELSNMKESGVEIEAMDNYGGNTSLKSKIFAEEVDECILWLSIVFITILCTPQPTILRWSASPPVSEDILLQWKGFCAIIANAYYMRGMAWLPVKTLQLEQMAVVGCAEEPSIVASRMRLVFSTLEIERSTACPKRWLVSLTRSRSRNSGIRRSGRRMKGALLRIWLRWLVHSGPGHSSGLYLKTERSFPFLSYLIIFVKCRQKFFRVRCNDIDIICCCS